MPKNKSNPVKKQVPAAQALHYTLQRARESIIWLREIEKERKLKLKERKDCYKLGLRSGILSDIVSVYVATLTEKNGSGHSLVKSYTLNNFVKRFVATPIVKKCRFNRNNRSGHESRSYGNFIRSHDILSADLEKWFSDIEYFLAITPEKR